MKKKIRVFVTVVFLFLFGYWLHVQPLFAQEVEAGWDEEDRTEDYTRKVSTAISVYTKAQQSGVTVEEGLLDGVTYNIMRVTPSNDTVVQVDYNEEPQYLSDLKDQERISQGYRYVGSINAGYFSNGSVDYGKPVGAVRRNNAWTNWYGSDNTPAYGSGFATAYIKGNQLSLKYHGWRWGFWHGDDSWKWWRGYQLDADYGVSGSYTYYVDGIQQDITNGDFGGVDYRSYGRAVTILAQKSNKQYLLITIFGTVSEERIKTFLGELKVQNAIRMDGGLSTQMVYEDSLVKVVDPELAYTKIPEDIAAQTSTKIGDVKVSVDGLAIRLEPTTDSTKLGTARNGKTYAVYQTKNQGGYTWYQIGTSRWIAGKTGWVSYQEVQAKQEPVVVATPEPTKEEIKVEEPTQDTVTVKVDGLTIRASGSINAQRLGYAENGKTYTIYETSKDNYYTWYRIGDKEWIAGKPEWVTVNQKETTNTQTGSETRGTVTVKVDQLIMRKTPSLTGDRIGYAENGKTYTVYETKTNQGYTWYRVGEDQWFAGTDAWVTYKQ